MRFFLVVFALFAVLAGCGNEENSLYDKHEDRDGTTFVNNEGNPDHNSIGNNTRMDTYQNPNFLHLDGSEPQKDTDIDKVKGVVKRFIGYEPASVWVNGQKMTVTVHTKNGEGLTKDEVAALEKKLVAALPTYYFNVKMKEKE